MTLVIPPARVLALQALKIATGYAEAGTHEVGGNNRGDQIEFFQHLMGGSPGDPWCADFVSTCLVKGFAQLTGQPEGRGDLPHYIPAVNAHFFHLSGYCPALANAAKQSGMFRDKHFTPSTGDIVLYDFLGQGEPHHTGFVRRLGQGDILLTVEGNTPADGIGNQADGDGVFLKTRNRNHVFGFIHFA